MKKFKKLVSRLVPKSRVKEELKLLYYSIIYFNKVKFELITKENQLKYKTYIDEISFITHTPFYLNIFEINCYEFLYKAKKGDIIIDAGANIGITSVYFATKVGINGKVYAFEPDVLNINQFKKNLEINSLQNIEINDSLLWNVNTHLKFNELGTVGSFIEQEKNDKNLVLKSAITLDSWVELNKIERIDFIKMDIEGAEIEALEGSIATIKKLRPKFAIASYHYVNGEQTYIKLEKFFKELNYSFKTIKFKKNEIITFAGYDEN